MQVNNTTTNPGNQMPFKVPPHSIDSEQSVLGGLMLSNASFEDVSMVLNQFDFYTKQHQAIYNAIVELNRANKPFDLVTVVEFLEATQQIELAGGKSYLAELVANTPGAGNIMFYTQIVREKSILRKLIEASNDVAESCFFTKGKDVREILDFAESKIMAIAEHGEGKQRQYKTIDELLVSAINRIDELFNSDGSITGIATHLNEFDEMTSGLQRGDLLIVAGRPSMGKTSFSMNIAENVATKSGQPVAVFSMEMPGEQLAMRMISSLGRIDAHRMRTGKLQPEDWAKMNKSISLLSNADIYIDDTPALMITELRARARRIDKDIREKQRRKAIEEGVEDPESKVTGLGLVVIDYLQLMRGSQNTDNRVNEISEISRGLKALAKELNIPLIALSQLNRSLEQRPDKRPKMSDLRESGAIEQDADLIIFIYRDEVYHPDSDDKGTAEIIIGKHRNGSIGSIRLTFIGQYTRFDNYISMSPDDMRY
ncbi:replicative DNA helicase [Thiomicrospira sp. R3]|uniref:replicative DNA helicase n=1 Tax=Thiomicrospira sp. R3 TaxID=3035472 RepID=UPI00259B8658|nr:replicative DNA helicase [Thiomicrospira sp. R3]WFE68451.1 replicative DNA helicase [Thiomicrospira sp. R3]